ncbi:MAG: CoA-binding protein [Bernardetiaceae bacterium]|nr:CoA-binding protein [Bernardetiaceae bacterium]
MNKKTLILGATDNPARYAFRAANMLQNEGHDIVPVGIKNGQVLGKEIIKDKTQIFDDIDTITLYVGTRNQAEWYDYILKTAPKRLIFNPGTENSELQKLAQNKGIQTENSCTLVLLSIGQY